jgi:hypothetical protein
MSVLEQAAVLIRAGNIEEARPLLIEYLKQNPKDHNAWLWMSRCVAEAEQKRYCFEKVLKIDPQNQYAIRGLERLNKLAPSTPPPKPASQPVSQEKPKKNNSLVLILAGISIFGLCLVFVCFAAWGLLPAENSPPVPTQRTRPDYDQLLKANGFKYVMSDKDGNPSYSSPCGVTAVVRPDSVGFVVSNSDDNTCATNEVGRIIRVMYPSEVFDFVITGLNSLNKFDQVDNGTAVGYTISVALTEYEHTLMIIIRDPR